MRIQSSTIAMSSKSSLIINQSKDETLKMWIGNKRPDFEGRNQAAKKPSILQLDILDLSEKAKKALEAQKQQAIAETKCADGSTFELSDEDKQKIQMIEDLLTQLTGKKFKLHMPVKIKIKPTDINIDCPSKPTQPAPPERKGWGVEYDYHESQYEYQKMSFSSEGVIKTADGREINFSVDLSMTREFASRTDISLRAGDAQIDPLVINFGGNAPQLTTTKFSFDLDSDGKEDQISFAGLGSGFLALDVNSDGKINDGKELFGPQSGNGFSELAKYDSDSNNWIDENDPIFDKLRIWTKDAEGNDKLFALGEKGIGAIYLGNVDTNFSMKDGSNQSLGEIQKTGIFVNENGSVGTIQHIDLTL